MKKIIIAIVAVAVVAACAAGAYFAFFNNSNDNAPAELSVVRDDFVEGIGFLEAIIKNPERYNSTLGKEYQMDEETVNKFFAAPEEWLAYEQIINIKNIGEADYTVYGYEVKDNGKNGVYISTSAGGELGLPVGGKATTSFTVLCSNPELAIEELKALVDEMEISVLYTKTPVEYDDGTESIEETKAARVEAPSAE